MPQDLGALVRAAEEQERRRSTQAGSAALYSARSRNPEQAALARSAARDLGLSPIVVQPTDIEDARAIRDQRALVEAPNTAAWLARQENAEVAHDQVEGLSMLERVARSLAPWGTASGRTLGTLQLMRDAAGGLGQGLGTTIRGAGRAGARVFDGSPLENDFEALNRIGRRVEIGARNVRGTLTAVDRAMYAPDERPMTDRVMDTGFVGEVAAGVGQIGGQIGVHIGTAGALTLPSLFSQGVGQMEERVDEAREREGRTGEAYSTGDDIALLGGGVVTALSERIGLNAVLGRLPEPIKRRLTNKWMDIAVAGIAEAGSEITEAVGQNALARYALGEDTGLLDGSVEQGSVAAVVGSLARAMVMTAIPGRQYVADADRAAAAQQAAQTFAGLKQAVTENPLLKRSPDAMADYLGATMGDQTVYLPASAAATFFQSNPDLDPWLDEWELREQYDQALATGADIAIPLPVYLSRVNGTQADEAWAEDVRFGVNGMSAKEAAEFQANAEQSLTEAFDAADAREAEAAPAMEAEKAVEQTIFGQLREAGFTVQAARVQATIEARKFARRAERFPDKFPDALSAFQGAGLSIRQEFPETLRGVTTDARLASMVEALKRGRAAPTAKQMFGRSLLEFVSQEGGIEDTGGELAAMGADQWHRGRSFRRRLVREAGEGKFTSDYVTERAVEAGYLPEGSTGNDLLEAMREEIAGRPRYSEGVRFDPTVEANARALDDLEQTLANMGLSPQTDSLETIAAALEAASAEPGASEGVTLQQRDLADLLADTRERMAARQVAVQRIVNRAPNGVRMERGDLSALVGPNSVEGEQPFRVTYLDADGPSGHSEFATYEAAVTRALEDGYAPTDQAVTAPDAPQTNTAAFKAWFGASKVVDENGEPLVVYHGTTGDFEAFDQSRANPESDLGAGFYFTTEQGDVAANYAGEGPDLTQRIERRAEQIAGETDREYDDPEVIAEAKAALSVEHGGMTLPVYLSIQNPVVIGGEQETTLDYEEAYDEETDEYGEPTGKLIELAEALRDVMSAEEVFEADADKAVSDLLDYADGGITATQVISRLKESEGLIYATDENGDVISNEIIRRAFEAIGFDGYIDHTVDEKFGSQRRTGKAMEGMNAETVHYVAFKPTQIKSAIGNRGTFDPADPRILYQREEVAPRGSIRLGQNRAEISLFASRNLSTFTHESGHLWLDLLMKDAAEPNAPEDLKADARKVLGWFGTMNHSDALAQVVKAVEDAETSAAKSGKPVDIARAEQMRATLTWAEANGGAAALELAGRSYGAAVPAQHRDLLMMPYHEWFARGWERYMMEGRAPSRELRPVFRQISAWLKSIYKTVLNLNAPITDEIRDVMSRMLASEEEIAQAREASGIEQGFADAAQAGMTGEAFTAYTEAVTRARTDAEDELLRRVMRAIRRERTAEWNAAADEIRPSVEAEVDAMPDVAAINFITRTKTPLNREIVVGMLGSDAGLALLPKRVPPLVTLNGAHPDTVAEAAGYSSGMAMLDGLMTMEAEKRAMVEKGDSRSVRAARIDSEITTRLREQMGDPLTDGSIEEEALAVVHAGRQAEVLGMELAALARRVDKTPSPINIMREWAAARIGGRPITEAKPGRFLRAERAAANATQKALADGNREEAFRQKQAQTINHLLYSEARKAEEDVEKAVARMRKLGGKRTVKSMDQDYLDRIHDLLRRFDLTDVPQVQVRARASLLEFVREKEAAGQSINIPEKLLVQAKLQHYSTLTVDEVRELDTTIQHLAALGRLKKDLIVAGERRDFERAKAEAIDSAAPLPDKPYREAVDGPEGFDRVGAFIHGSEASLVKAQAVLRRLDGNRRGIWTKMLDEGGQRAADKLFLLRERFWSGIIAAERAIPAKVRARWTEKLENHPVINPRTGEKMSGLLRRDLVGMARHVGTMSNFEKMAKGWGIVPEEADEFAVANARTNFIAWLTTELDPAEWDYVQAWWDAHEAQRDEYFDNERELTGIRPIPVEAEPVGLPGRTLRGGYAPISYHAEFDDRAAAREAEDAQDMFGGFTRRPSTSNGAAQDRTAYTGPVNLSMGRAAADAQTQMVRISHGRYITDALKFLRDPDIREVFRLKAGDDAYRQIEAWLGAQVKDGAPENPGSAWWEKLLRGARTNFSAAVLLGSATVLIAQPAGLMASAAALGGKRLAGGIANAARLAVTGDYVDFVFSRSTYMRQRINEGAFDRDIRASVLKNPGAEGVRERIVMWTAQAVGWVDFMFVSGPTWLAAYDQAGIDGMTPEEAARAADAVVQRTQGGGRPIDLAGVQRQNEVTKMLTFAFGWANAHYNLQRDYTLDVAQGRERFKAMTSLFFLLVAAPLVDAMLSGDWPKPEEDEDDLEAWGSWFLRNVLFGIPVGIPVVRDFANVAEREAQGKYGGEPLESPLTRVAKPFLQTGQDIANAFDPEKPVSSRWPSHVITAVGFSLGIPGTIQATRAVNYLTDVNAGEQNPEHAGDWINGLLRGPQADQE